MGWKNKKKFVSRREGKRYILFEHRKRGSKVTKDRYEVEKTRVDKLFEVIKEKCKDKGYTKYGEVMEELCEFYDVDVPPVECSTGKNRRKYYFPLYFHPLKVLEDEDKIQLEHQKIRVKD